MIDLSWVPLVVLPAILIVVVFFIIKAEIEQLRANMRQNEMILRPPQASVTNPDGVWYNETTVRLIDGSGPTQEDRDVREALRNLRETANKWEAEKNQKGEPLVLSLKDACVDRLKTIRNRRLASRGRKANA